jgi:hypothetical protein
MIVVTFSNIFTIERNYKDYVFWVGFSCMANWRWEQDVNTWAINLYYINVTLKTQDMHDYKWAQ